MPQEKLETIADDLHTGLGELNFRLLVERGVEIHTATDDELEIDCVAHPRLPPPRGRHPLRRRGSRSESDSLVSL